MAKTSLDIRQSQTRVLQDQIDSAAVTQMDSVLASINNELTAPGRLIAASTPSLVVTINSGTVVNPNTSKNRVLPLLNNVAIPFTGGTITFPSTTGTITVSPGTNGSITIGASQFIAVLVQLDTTGSINLSVGSAASSLGAVVVPGGSTSFLSLGYIVVQSNASSVIQSVTNAMLYQFVGGGGAGGSGTGGLGDDLASLQFRADILDVFSESPAISTTTINNASTFTNASYSSSKNMYAVSYDASKTATSASTAVTMSANPAYTVVAGDVLINPTTGEVKKITVVTSQTSYTIESAFAANLATTAVVVSQAVHTKDVYNLAVDSNGNTIASAFPSSTFSEIAVFYKDNSTANSNQWAIDTAANVAWVGSPDNSTWTVSQKRATNVTDQFQSTILSSAGSSLYIRFFSNKTSGSGVVNLIMYKAYMQKATTTSPQGGVQFAAYGVTNNSTTPVGCTIATTGGKTTITLTGGNQYAVGVNSTQTYGACDVYLNGQLLPRFVSGTVPATDSYFTEVSGTVIQLDKDYSSLQLEVTVLVRAQVVDTSTTNTTQLASVFTSALNNRLINSAFDVWQRGTSTTIANAGTSYQADRWYAKNSLGTNGVLTYSQATGVLTGSKFGASVQITTAPTAAQTNGTELYQVLENLNSLDLMGQPVSCNANVKALGNVNQVGIQFCYATTEAKPTLFFGSEQLVTVNSSTFSVGQLLAQNSGTLTTSSGVIGIRIRITGVSTGNLYDLNNGFVVEQAMIILGGVLPTYFFRAGRNAGEELTMCQRYYEISGGNGVWFAILRTSGATSIQGPWRFIVTKRATPSCSTTGTFNVDLGSTTASQSAMSLGGQNINTATISFTATSSPATGQAGFLNGASSTAALIADAEI